MFAVIYIPNFALQAVLRDNPGLYLRPVILVDGAEKNAVVFQLTPTAREAGIREGQTAAQAMARCDDLLIRPRSVPNESAATEILLQTAYCFSPRIESTAHGVCSMDLQGLSGLQDGSMNFRKQAITEWAEKILVTLKYLGLSAQIGVAATPHLALHAARHGEPVLVIDEPGRFISSLPIGFLNPAPQILDILQRWGIRTVGDFIALGKNRVTERLGPDALELFDQVSLTKVRPLKLITPSEQFTEAMDLEAEIESLDPLLFILQRFVEQLARRIETLHLAIADLRLKLKLSSGAFFESHLRIPSPTADRHVLFRMLQTHLETVRTDSPIAGIELSATPTRPENFQFGLFESSLRDPNQFAETLARLSALCDGRAGSAVLENSYRPDTFRMVSPSFDQRDTPISNASEDIPATPLYLRRYRPPFHADVETENGRPVFISSLKVNSPIRKAFGPFRGSGEWWEPGKHWQRDEWDIETADGTVYRICHANNDWFIEGIYD